jgi:hypothetical protein
VGDCGWWEGRLQYNAFVTRDSEPEMPQDREPLARPSSTGLLGIQLFAAAIRKSPSAALARLLLDYLTFLGMVAFWLLLVASKWPLAWLDRRLRRPLRPRLVAWIARIAHG